MKQIGVAFAIAAALTLISGCRQGDDPVQEPAPAATRVTVNTLRLQKIDMETTWPGRVSALRTAQIRPQVGGMVSLRACTEWATGLLTDPSAFLDSAS